ncbi:MAG TPA: hypothetical protein PKA90_13520 [Ignavibacteria bacterium]|nr:hypothetical protein [Ignavibacteria bacterium]
MKDSKLISILKTLTSEEFKEFEKFTDSPYFSYGRDLSSFLRCIKGFYPEFDSSQLTEEALFSRLYPEKKFDPGSSINTIHKLSSELYKLSKEFLIYSEFRRDTSSRNIYLLNNLRKKKLYREFEKEYSKSELFNISDNKGSVNDFLNEYFLQESFLEYSIEKGNIKKAFDAILTAGEYIVISALIKGFRNIDTNQASEGFNISVRYNLPDNLINHLDSEKLLEEMKENEDRFYPYAAISYAIHKMKKYPDDTKLYFEYKDLVMENLDLFGHSEKYILFQTMINHCINNNKGENEMLFIREEFEVYNKEFELGIYKYSPDDYIQVNTFRSIIGCALDNGKMDWLENILNKHIDDLHPDQRKNMKYYTMAFIHFQRKEFEKALECTMKINFNFVLFKMDVKNLLFKIYFELGYFEQAYSVMDAAKHYISKTKDLSEILKIRESNFLKYAAELLKAVSGNKTADKDRLILNIEKESNITSKNWLISKTLEL